MKPGRLQQRIISWLQRTYGPQTLEKEERSLRYAEESMELLQAAGVDKYTLLKIVDHVYSRPKGEVEQEVTGSYITLVGMCHAHGIDLHNSVDSELDRVEQIKDVCRTKHDSKPSFMRTHDSKKSSIRTLERTPFADVVKGREFETKREEFIKSMSDHLRSMGLHTSFVHRALSIYESVASHFYDATRNLPSLGLEIERFPLHLGDYDHSGNIYRDKSNESLLIGAVVSGLPVFDVVNSPYMSSCDPVYGTDRSVIDIKVTVFAYNGLVYKLFYVPDDGHIVLKAYCGTIHLPVAPMIEALCKEVHIYLQKEIAIDSPHTQQESSTIKFIL